MSSSQQEQIGSFIRALREERGLTQSQFARRLKTSQSAVARMERGEQNFTTDMLSKISNALHKDIITLGNGAINFRIEGGRPLKGTIVTNTSKNTAVALLCASLLNRGTTTLKKMPRIEEVFRVIEVLVSIGVTAKWFPNNDLELTPPKRLSLHRLNRESAIKTRSVIMLLGPLIHYLPTFRLPFPGGCKLGERTVRPHLFALERLGVRIETTNNEYRVTRRKLRPNEIVMYESGDTATENTIMAASLLTGITTIKFASANYMVQDLCYFLERLGIVIEGIGTTTLRIHGKPSISQNITYAPSEDPIESMLFLSVAATTKSSITIKRCPIDFLELELLKLEKMGFRVDRSPVYLAENKKTRLVDLRTHPSTLHALEDKIEARPYPGLNIDNLPFFVPIATQATGKTLIHDWVFENRAIYYLELAKIGANLLLADPHRVYVEGPTPLTPAEVICPPALRPAVIILIGMLAAPGVSVLRNVYSINRGYEDLSDRLQSLGARISMIKSL